MNDNYWRAISIECIDPDTFPSVPLYIKSNGNYVLYKDAERKFTRADHDRLERTQTEFVYLRTGDMQEICSYLESSLKGQLHREDLDSRQKGAILYQSSINFIIDALEEPENVANLQRCQELVRNMMDFLSHDHKALSAVSSVIHHNFYIFAHSVQMAALNLMAHESLLHSSAEEMVDIGVASLLHDYGMVFISNEILQNPSPLSDVEYYKIKQHAQKGYEFLKDTGAFSELTLNIVRYHHERFDGDGYPVGLKGDRIPVSAQLAALCDSYSAMTLDKVYRKAAGHEEAVKAMRLESGKAFQPELLNRFIELLNDWRDARAEQQQG